MTGYAIYKQTVVSVVATNNRFKLAIIYGIVGLVAGGFALPHGVGRLRTAGRRLALSAVVGVLRGYRTDIWMESDGRIVRKGNAVTILLFVGLVAAKFGMGVLAYFKGIQDGAGFGEIMVMIAVMVAFQAEIVYRRAQKLARSVQRLPLSTTSVEPTEHVDRSILRQLRAFTRTTSDLKPQLENTERDSHHDRHRHHRIDRQLHDHLLCDRTRHRRAFTFCAGGGATRTASELFLNNYILWAIGVAQAVNFVMHSVFGDFAASTIGWAQSPFQLELAFSSLGIAVMAFILHGRTTQLRAKVALVAATAVFAFGAAGGHVYQMVANHDYSANNTGLLLVMDIVIAVVGIALVVWNAVARREGDARIEQPAEKVLVGNR